MTRHQSATIETNDTARTSEERKATGVKLLVLYPAPADPEQFERRYQQEHLPMGKANLIGATGFASYRILGSPAGKSPFARLTEVTFPTLKALQDCAALPGAQKTIANAVEISTGGAPHFMVVEQES